MKTNIKNVALLLLFSITLPGMVLFGQVTLSRSVIANGGGEAAGSHTLTATIGQAIVGTSGTILTAGFWNAPGIVTGINDNLGSTIPKEYKLNQNYPNPFNPSTAISYQLSAISFVTLKVYDALGREVMTLVNKEQPVGNYRINFDASNLTSGIYFYRIVAGSFVQTKKMVLLK